MSLQQSSQLGSYEAAINETISTARKQKVASRAWEHDHTLWKPDPDEITNRLGWLDIASRMQENIAELTTFAAEVCADGITDVLLLGMGGSSLAPDLFALTFGSAKGHPDLKVLDSTDPGAVAAHAERLDPATSLFVVSTKSGGTVETLSFFKYFYNWTVSALGKEAAGSHFIAVTDPGSKLAALAADLDFRKVFENDPTIGGRFSALSYFGLVPAALIGVDLVKLLTSAIAMEDMLRATDPAENPGVWLGVTLGELAEQGRDKLTLVTVPGLAAFGDWVEQLIAESTGKEGKGIVPVVGEPLGALALYGEDRVFVDMSIGGPNTALRELAHAGHPVIHITLDDVYDLGGQFVLWEFATAVAGWRMGIQPFDQPNVESSKVASRKVMNEFSQTGMLPQTRPAVESDGMGLFGDVSGDSVPDALRSFLEAVRPGDYISLQAYLPPHEGTSEALQALRLALREQYHVATTTGYGPRFLHSTGQLHKGDDGSGVFIQFSADMPQYAGIPDEPGSSVRTVTFAILKTSQVLGDAEALRAADRRMVRIHLGSDPVSTLKVLTKALES